MMYVTDVLCVVWAQLREKPGLQQGPVLSWVCLHFSLRVIAKPLQR